MAPKPLLLLLLAAVTLCCISSLHAHHGKCLCIRTSPSPMNPRVIKKIEVIPISGNCRRTEIIVTRRNGSKVCVKPSAKWVVELLSRLQRAGCITGRAFPCVGRHLLR